MVSERFGVDVLILSYSKSRTEYDITANCLTTLLASEEAVDFHVVVVESAPRNELEQLSAGRLFGDRVQVVFPEKPFNYNEFLQIGFATLSKSRANFLLIANNDVVFDNGFATELIRALGQFDSVSPWCPGYHERYLTGSSRYYVSYRVTIELCGWALMFRKSILLQIPFEELFPDDFAFWYQDNFYSFQLESHGLRHALVPNARVHHLGMRSHPLVEPSRYEELTREAERVFQRKTLEIGKQKRPSLTIAIPTLATRVRSHLPTLVEKLDRQAAGKPVELLALLDNRRSTLGAKRNKLAWLAKGMFLVYVDDDDDVADDYVDALLRAIEDNGDADCIVFDAWVSMNGEPDRICKYGIEFEDADTPESYFRHPNHVSCFRTQLAREFPRDDVTWGEDGRWATLVHGHVHKQARIDRVLYHYRCDVQNSDHRLPSHTQIELSICILSIPSRVGTSLPSLVEKLHAQSQDKDVEILSLLDNKWSSIGAKRNVLLNAAKGRFVAFVDDDDDIAEDYVDALLQAIRARPDVDCIVFDAWVTEHGTDGKPCHYGMEFSDRDAPEAYFRLPGPICCVRRDLAQSVSFEHLNLHDGFHWATALWPRLRTQTRISRVLYYHRGGSGTRETGFRLPRVTGSDSNEERPRQANTGQDSVAVSSPKSHPIGLAAPGRPVEPALPIFGFMHVALLPGWREIVDEQLLKLLASGLYDKTQRVFVGLVGGQREVFDYELDKLEVVIHSEDISLAELPTLKHMRAVCAMNDCLVYYLHTKGITWDSENARDWRRLLEHYVILRHEHCLQKLLDHDVCGVNWHFAPVPHFSGNIWWARSSYIRTLPDLQESSATGSMNEADGRRKCEFWIGDNCRARVAILHESAVDHYHSRYPRSRYASLREVHITDAFSSHSGWRGLENRFQDLLEPLQTIRMVVCVGVECGYSVFALASAAPQATVLGIDPYLDVASTEVCLRERPATPEGPEANEALSRICSYLGDFPNIVLCRETSDHVASRLIGQVDIVHIDAIATPDELAQSFGLWEPLVRPGGCILLHDVESSPVVKKFFGELPGRKVSISGHHGLGAWYKPLQKMRVAVSATTDTSHHVRSRHENGRDRAGTSTPSYKLAADLDDDSSTPTGKSASLVSRPDVRDLSLRSTTASPLVRTLLVQVADGPHVELLELTQNHHRRYAERHGMDYWCVFGNPAAPKRPGWAKALLILAGLRMGYDTTVWLDADAVIMEPDVNLAELVGSGIGMVQHPNPTHWNAGLIVVARSAQTEEFFEIIRQQLENDSPWMEQLAINQLALTPEFSRLVTSLDARFNSTPGAVMSDKPVILAAHGHPMEVRRDMIARWLAAVRTHEPSPKVRELLTPLLESERICEAQPVLCREDFAAFLNTKKLVGEAAEIGVQRGEFAAEFLRVWNGRTLHLVDPWRHLADYDDISNVSDHEHEACFWQALTNLRPYVGNFEIHRKTSEEAAADFSDESLDFVYIDANHHFEYVLRDVRSWYAKVKGGGILAGHDYIDGVFPEGNFGVQSAVNAFANETGLKVYVTCEPNWPSWYVVKPGCGDTTEPRTVKLSLCMIVRDSARTLEAALASIRPWVDEMVVVDTGSLDDTPEIARRCGARVFSFPWCDDFSAARNESLRHARGEWIFWMDSDDTIDAENGRRLRDLANSDEAQSKLGYVVQVHCPCPSRDGSPDTTVVDHVKLFRHLPEFRFEGRIHEQVLSSIRSVGGEVAWTNIFVVHSGADHSPEGRKRKHERDLRILQLELKEKPDHPFVLFNLGMTYADTGEYEKAVDALKRSILLSPASDSHVRKAYALLVSCLVELGRLDSAREACLMGRQIYPQDVELHFRQGIVAHRRGSLEEAANAYEKVFTSHEDPHFASIDKAIQGHKTHHNLAIVYHAMNRLPEAEYQWRHAVQSAPLFRPGWRSLGACLVQQQKYNTAHCLAEQLLAHDNLHVEGLLLKARLAEAQQRLRQVQQYLEDALLHAPDDPEVVEFLSRIRFQYGDYRGAQDSLLRLTTLAPHDPAAHQNLGATYLESQDFSAAERCFLTSLQLRPDSPTTLYWLGQALLGLGRGAESLETFRRAQQLAPDDPLIREAVASVQT